LSAPNIPNITPVISLDREDAINLLLSSIAMEELGLSHILNAEGEKIQYLLGGMPGSAPPARPSVDQMLAMNESVRQTLDTAMKHEMHLQSKLETVIGLLRMGGKAAAQGAPGSPGTPAWSAAHAFTASTSNQTVAISSSGTPLRFPDNQVLAGVTKNSENTVFTVPATGHYLVTYLVNIELAASEFIALTVNDVIFAPGMLTAGGAAGYTATVIVPLAGGGRLSVKIYGPGRTTNLFDGAGATLTIVRIR
jgi:hypothetical protein